MREKIREIASLFIFLLTIALYFYYFYYFYPIKCYNYGAFNMGYGFIFPFAIFFSLIIHIIIGVLTKKKFKKYIYWVSWVLFLLFIIPMPFPC